MTKRYRVSKKGLTRCPKCARHIFLADAWKETHCEFCSAHLVSGPAPSQSGPLRSIQGGRSGFIAAGLLSMSLGTVGCLSDGDSKSGDQGVSSDASISDRAMSDAMTMRADRPLQQPAYGGVGPDVGPPPEVDMSTVPADRGVDQPLYGAVGPDAQIDAAPDPGSQPEYGAPPESNG